MKITRYIFIMLFIVSLLVCLTACVDETTHITYNSDGSGTVSLTAIIDKSLLDTLSVAAPYSLNTILDSAKSDGYNVSRNLTQTQSEEIVFTKNVSNIDKEIKESSFLNTTCTNNAFKNIASSTEVKKEIFQTTYSMDSNINIESITPKLFNSDNSLVKTLNNSISNELLRTNAVNMKLKITFPLTPSKHNASSTEEDGKTLVWVLSGSQNNISYTLVAPNITNIIILVVLIGIVVIMILASIPKKIKK